MADHHLDALRVSDSERHEASRRLQLACVHGFLTLEELSERVGRALAAQTRGELARLTADLPTAAQPAALAGATPVKTMLVVLSGVERSGMWRIAERSSVLVVAGSYKLDLRHVTIAASLTTISVRVILGSLEVVVPSGVDVDVLVSSVLSTKSLRIGGPPPGGRAPRVLISGVVLGGSLSVRDVPRRHTWQA